jgi:hypothetical protein
MKKSTIIFFLFILISEFLCAQEKEKKHRWSISGFFYPEYTYRFLGPSHHFPKALLPRVKNADLGKYGYSTGILLELKIKKWLAFKTGINYFDMGYSEWPHVYASSWESKTYTNYKCGMINIPLKISYIFLTCKSFYGGCDLGIHPAIIRDHSLDYVFTDYDLGYMRRRGESPYRYLYNFLVSFDCNFKYGLKRWIFGLSGGFKMNLMPVNSDVYTQNKTYTFKKFVYSAGGGIIIGRTL